MKINDRVKLREKQRDDARAEAAAHAAELVKRDAEIEALRADLNAREGAAFRISQLENALKATREERGRAELSASGAISEARRWKERAEALARVEASSDAVITELSRMRAELTGYAARIDDLITKLQG